MRTRCGVYVGTLRGFADPALVVDMGRRAERAGWDGFFVYDHLFLPGSAATLDPWVPLGAVAATTSEIRLGALVVPLPRRHPWTVAHQAVALNQLSGGRAILGAGLGIPADYAPTGDLELTAKGTPIRALHAQRLDLHLEVLRGLLRGDAVSLERTLTSKVRQETHSLVHAQLGHDPVHGEIPIWGAASYGRSGASPGPRPGPARRAAGLDGVMPICDPWQESDPLHVRELTAVLDAARAAGAPVGEDGYEVVAPGYSTADAAGRAHVDAFRNAGATWWLELVSPAMGREAALARIDAGPPR
jgi:alkanesulfonate monooxygenase SsuD/methylene tetrahydromethanopterin reductase-like flavin-dependent oxidoreductase (luciferase family)